MTVSAVSHSLKVHSAIKLKHFKKIGKRGYLTRDGATLLSFRKSPAGRRKESPVEFELNEVPVKEQDIQAVAMAEFMNDPFIAMRINHLQLQKRQDASDRRIEAMEEKLGATSKLLEDVTPVDITASQRQFLNERVRNLAIKSGLPFSHVWGLVHDHVGKRPLEAYEFSDYPKAMKLVKKIYDQYKLE